MNITRWSFATIYYDWIRYCPKGYVEIKKIYIYNSVPENGYQFNRDVTASILGNIGLFQIKELVFIMYHSEHTMPAAMFNRHLREHCCAEP